MVKPVEAAVAISPVAKKHSMLGDYAQLFKVRVTSLIVITAWTGYYMGAARSGVASVSWTLLNSLWGIGLTSAGAAALNEVLERDLDARMSRTKDRPLPAGRMDTATGALAGSAAGLIGSIAFALTTNLLPALPAFAPPLPYLRFLTPPQQAPPLSPSSPP